ncbi:MAG: ribosome maturation factor RimP [Deltaproteobacteria bacterium]|nr:ribosome maturation factor RimP [Syntrophaceae bacterium]NLX52267.1 ribosome maturation factor RimP [Deltaproteobacteria bacterium]
MYDDLRDKIWRLAEPVAAAEGMELIFVECLKMHSRWVFRLFLDKEGGVTLDDCTTVSNQLGDILDVHDLSHGPYTLEVSSPGLDRPLFRDIDFERFVGAKVKLKTSIKIDGVKNFQGKLVDYTEENGEKVVRLAVADKVLSIRKKDLVKANLVDETATIAE